MKKTNWTEIENTEEIKNAEDIQDEKERKFHKENPGSNNCYVHYVVAEAAYFSDIERK
jgi:hypothetical protein